MIAWSGAARALFDLSGPTAVSAGAGSGKTTCLVELCVRLLAGEADGVACDPAEVVAITFTEKAAEELSERLREALAVRASTSDAAESRAWRERLRALDRMPVGTIHGFAGRLLREHALEAGLDPAFEVLDEEAAAAGRRAAARAAVVAALDEGRVDARVLCAGHGAGGHRAGLADLVADLARERATLGDGRPPEPALDRSAEALAARAEVLAGADALLAARAAARTGTGADALARLAEARAGAERASAGALRVEALASVAALGAAVRGWRLGASAANGALRAGRERLLAACEAFAPLAAEALAGGQKQELCALLADAERRYADAKRAARAVDFDDLLCRARDLLRDDPALRDELRGRWRALLVDEYQDVNPVQQEIFDLLAGGVAPRPTLVAVGDLKQSIYRFRGADVSVFRGVIERFGSAPPARVLHLSENHRSSPAVLALVNELFSRCMQPGPGAPPYELAFSEADRLLPVRSGGEGAACEILEDGEGGNAAERRAREARAVAARIAALASGAAGVLLRDRGAPQGAAERAPRFGEIAVLFRRLTQIGEYERALRDAGIPHRLARGGGFYQAPEVRDLGELAASLADPSDALAWAALLRSPLCGVSDPALLALARQGLPTLAQRAPHEVVRALVEAYPAAGEGWPAISSATPTTRRISTSTPSPSPAATSTEADRLHRFLSTWQDLHAHRDAFSPGDLLAAASERLDLEAAHLSAPDGERRAANLRKALAAARRVSGRGEGLGAFAARLRALAAKPPREAEADLEVADAVALVSVHQAKGLEWPVVFVPDLGATPPRDPRRALRDGQGRIAAALFDTGAEVHHATQSLEEAKAEARRAAAAESRRLLYVALTRARDRLVLSGEAGRGGSETWRALVESGVASRPDLVVRIPASEAGAWRAAGRAPDLAPERVLAPAPARDRPASPRLRAATPPAPVRLSVTDLAEHARCPRRVFLARHLGVSEAGTGGAPARDDPDRATARGTLAHAMLAEIDLAASPLERRVPLENVARRRGYDPRARGIRLILGDVMRFLDSAAGKALAAAARGGALRREVPFLLRLEGEGAPACYLAGAVDAVVEGARDVAVVDYKYAAARPEARERYRLQLLAYVIAAGRAYPGRKITARLQFLRGACTSVDLTPPAAELRRFAREAPRLAAAAHAGEGLRATPEALGRTEARCAAEGCGFIGRCFGAQRR